MHGDIDFANPPKCRIGALAIIRNAAGGLLMVQKAYKGGRYGLPGGLAREDECAHDAVTREVAQETGLELTPGPLLAIDWVPRNPETGAVMGYNFVYDMGIFRQTPEITLPTAEPGKPVELTGYRFVAVEDLGDVTSDITQRRIKEALAAIGNGHTASLVEGRPAALASWIR
ncbi:NUDIX hydrolase [Streptomyces sp. NPDC004042]|uniref:NUDIX hydrolase n=1 Tax=Streptomyces sp. NPDC004042 TaxID=3154451 RepID=UPI0033B8AEF7